MASQTLASEPLGARRSFYSEALYQGKCAVSGSRSAGWDPHHVIRWQDLKRMGLPRYDPRNVLRISGQVHVDHTNARRKIRTVELLNCNIEYAVEMMGAERATSYLRRYYDDVEQPDPRLEALCPAIT
jgi:hypothetical protein